MDDSDERRASMRGLPPSNDFCQSLSHLLQLCLQSFKQPFALLLLCAQILTLEEPPECQDYLKVEAKHVAATQNCPNLTTWCRNSEDNLNERKILKLLLLMSRRIAPLTIPKRRPHKTEKRKYVNIFLKYIKLQNT